MSSDYLKVGKAGERIARDFLRSMLVIASNFRTRFGELDIVARDGDTFVFVEVKTRTSIRFGTPIEAVTPQKIHKLKMMIAIYVANNHLENFPQRLDVIGVTIDNEYKALDVQYIQGVEV